MALLVKKIRGQNKDLEMQLMNTSRRKSRIINDTDKQKLLELEHKEQILVLKTEISDKIKAVYEKMISTASQPNYPFPRRTAQRLISTKKKIEKPKFQLNTKQPMSTLSRPKTQKNTGRPETTTAVRHPNTEINTPRDKRAATKIRKKAQLNPINDPKLHLSPQKNITKATLLKHTKQPNHQIKEFHAAIPPISVTKMDAPNTNMQSFIFDNEIPEEPNCMMNLLEDEIPETTVHNIIDLRIENQKLRYELDQIDSDIGVLQHKKKLLLAKDNPDYKIEFQSYYKSKKELLKELKKKVKYANKQKDFIKEQNIKITEKIQCLSQQLNINNETMSAKLKAIKQYISRHLPAPVKTKPACVPMLDIAGSGIGLSKGPISIKSGSQHQKMATESSRFNLNLSNVPKLSLAAASGGGLEFMPGTRSTRRAFSSFNTERQQSLPTTSTEDGIIVVGKLIGASYLDRFASIIGKDSASLKSDVEYPFKGEISPTVDRHLRKIEWETFVVRIIEHYKSSRAQLHLTMYTPSEVHIIEDSFLQFFSVRNHMFSIFLEEQQAEEFLSLSKMYLDMAPEVAPWLIRDFVLVNNQPQLIPELIDRMLPYFETMQVRISRKLTEELLDTFVGWMSVFSAFYTLNQTNDVRTLLNSSITIDFEPIITYLQTNMIIKRAKVRSGLTALFSLAKFIPLHFVHMSELSNESTSVVDRFIDLHSMFPTVVAATCDFFIATRPFLNDDSLQWHTATFFKKAVSEIYQNPVRTKVLSKYLEVLTSIIANRSAAITEQLQKLNFLQFAIKQVELEAFVGAKPPEVAAEEKQPAVVEAPKNMSYLDIPSLKMPSVMPKLNLVNMENPKLQLTFQQTRQSPMRASISITDREYLAQRKTRPVYLTIDLHQQFVQMLFALLIDHSLHRLDTNFVDPFPHVNRKPNVLYTLMCHMEGKFNQDIAEPLCDAFTPKELDSEANEEKHEEEEEHMIGLGEISNLRKSIQSSTRLIQIKKKSEKKVSIDPLSMTVGPSPSVGNLALIKSTSLLMIPEETGSNEKFKLEEPPKLSNDAMQKLHLSTTRIQIQMFQSVPNFIALNQASEPHATHDFQSTTEGAFGAEQQKLQYQDYKRLLRLSAPELFHPEKYSNGKHIASGAFGAVMQVTLDGETLAVKILQKSRNEFDNPHLFETFTEVSILEMCKGDRRVTQLLDYGCTADSYYIVMEYYPMTLRSWRKSDGDKPLSVMLRIYREFLRSATVLTERHINHYDIKCDNVMLDRFGRPALADFGESMCYDSERNCNTMLNKGTEWIKSPEMLSIALNSSVTNINYDRRHRIGAGPPSDVWSIGCLFFELLSGEYLFVDSDWSRFFFRITDPKQVLIRPEDKAKLPRDNRIVGFLEFVLQRSVRHRPTLQQVITRFDEMFPDAMSAELPNTLQRK